MVIYYGGNRKQIHTDFINKPEEKHDLWHQRQVGRTEIPLPLISPGCLHLHFWDLLTLRQLPLLGFLRLCPAAWLGLLLETWVLWLKLALKKPNKSTNTSPTRRGDPQRFSRLSVSGTLLFSPLFFSFSYCPLFSLYFSPCRHMGYWFAECDWVRSPSILASILPIIFTKVAVENGFSYRGL